MHVGLKNAPAFFQRLIDASLGDLLGISALAYTDNILIFSPDKASHRSHLSAVLGRILEFDLTIKLVSARYSNLMYHFWQRHIQ